MLRPPSHLFDSKRFNGHWRNLFLGGERYDSCFISRKMDYINQSLGKKYCGVV